MEDRFEDEFVTWHHKTPIGVKVDEVFGMDSKSGKVWEELARQIYCEMNPSSYREIDHFSNGAPFIVGYPGRISISHTSHFFVGACLPKTPETDLSKFNPRTAMGIDVESTGRSKILSLRERFLSEKELGLIPEDDIEKNIMAWTAKEALYKAAMTPGLDFRQNLMIEKLPVLDMSPEITSNPVLGEAIILFEKDVKPIEQEMILYSYLSYGTCVTIAISPNCAKFGTKQ